MAVSGVATSGLISGLNVGDLVSKLLEIEQRPITLLKLRQNDYDLKIASVLNLKSKLGSYKTALQALNDAQKFNTKSASISKTSGGAELLKVTSSTDAIVGSYDINVNQIAKSNKLASEGVVDKTSTAISSGSGSFAFKVGSSGAITSVSVNSTTTLQELMDDINSKGGGVTASIINDGTGSNPYRLVLTAEDTGSANSITITTNNTDLDYTNKQVEAAYAYSDNTYSGTVSSNDGNNYTGTTNKTFMLKAVTAGESATATYKYSVDGGINWLGYGGAAYDSSAADDTSGGAITTSTSLTAVDGSAAANEGVTVSFTSGSSMAVGDEFSIDVFNPEMQEAVDAVIQVDNATIVKSSNTITDVIPGITLDLIKADTTETLTLSVSASSSSAKASIETFVNAYNNLFEFIDQQMSYDPDEDQANPLLGDPTLLEIRRKIGNAISGSIPGLSNDSFTNLSQIGITTDYKTGQLSLDAIKLNAALNKDADAVSKLFVGRGVPTNTALTFEGMSSKTNAGTYGVSISTAPEKAAISGDNDLSSTGLGSQEILTFKYSGNYTETDATFSAINVTLAADSKINTIVTTLNSAFATNDFALTASNVNGVLKIESNEYGEDIWFQVTSDQLADEDNNQIWDKATWDAESDDLLDDQGVDIAGSINNHVATGVGNILTAANGFEEEGIQISTTSSQTGLFGTIGVSLGIANRLPSILESYISSAGILKSKENSLQDSIDNLEGRIEIMQRRILDKEERMIAEFSRLEVLLAKYDALSQFMTTNLAEIPKVGAWR